MISKNFKLNDRVRILRINDVDPTPLCEGQRDCCVPGCDHLRGQKAIQHYVGKVGTIRSILTSGATGESVDDPLYDVSVVGLGTNNFWSEELEYEQ